MRALHDIVVRKCMRPDGRKADFAASRTNGSSSQQAGFAAFKKPLKPAARWDGSRRSEEVQAVTMLKRCATVAKTNSLKDFEYEMAYKVTVLSVMIASPGDVTEERNLIRDIIHEWNDINSKATECVLLPVGWETYSAPDLGRRA